ncbi:MAG: hypothetical protein ACI9SB_001123 [Candidatus Azotimanducaceae bacterium]|jgi:hypothetical protein
MPVPSTEILLQALQHRYPATHAGPANVSTQELQSALRDLALDPDISTKRLLVLLNERHPQWMIAAPEQAIIASVDDCFRLIFNLITLAPEVVSRVSTTVPELACHLLAFPGLPLSSADSILTILDGLGKALIGWSSELGRSGDLLLQQLEKTTSAITTGTKDIPAIAAELTAFLAKDAKKISKLEARLCATETGQLRSRQSKNLAANMLNEAMSGNQFTASIISFLQGHWYDSVQLLVLQHGVDSEEWRRAVKVSETIIWTYQPLVANEAELPQEKQHLYRIVESLSTEIRQGLVALKHNSEAVDAALEDIENDHVNIVSEQPLTCVDYTPLACDLAPSASSRISRLLLKKVHALQSGQWLAFKDGEQAIRIKLVLKLDDVKQLLFSNRNGVKVMEKSVEEFAYFLSSGSAKVLHHDDIFSSTFSTYYLNLIKEQRRQQQLVNERKTRFNDEVAASEQVQRDQENEVKSQRRAMQEIDKETRHATRKQRQDEARQEINKLGKTEKISRFTQAVAGLSVGAWLRLPSTEKTFEECKLAVRITSADKMIFVNKTGHKIGEYNSADLIELLMADQAEIQDHGVEFADTLAQVVSRLRHDRNKSYDDLTNK